ncbi:MAG TPA: thiamine pyrophosphate-dependent dehydrogenase E1 component subunit alpha [Longimicrobiales bacterium]|nr:thiamine pyrophosphate-dependent dehydrogenase E1 component subunit alpha [Longimicrobiales bacterium]
MRRYPAFDPPEYLDWEPEPQVVRTYRERIEADPERATLVAHLSVDDLLGLYRDLLRTRLHDIALKRWVRTGVISKAWLGTGEEAVTVGSVGALDRSRDVVCPMIRNAGALHMMGMPLADMFRGYLATTDSPNGGRDLHIGDPGRGIIQPVSHMGSSVPVMAGVALAFRRAGQERVALTWVGDGAIRTAAFHEGLNFAAVQHVPLVVVLQNNQVALGTRIDQHSPGDIRTVPDAYGLPSWSCDGNNVLDVLAASLLAAGRCRRGEGPAVVVAESFRVGGHATHDEREARETFPAELFRSWGRRDPVGLFEAFMHEEGIGADVIRHQEQEVTAEMEAAAEEALLSRDHTPHGTDALYCGFSEGGPTVGLDRRPIPGDRGRSVRA